MTAHPNTMSSKTPVQLAAMAVAGTFLLVGVLGFIPGITTNYGQMEFAGHTSEASLLGIFQVSILHNIVHLLFGVVGLVMLRTPAASKTYLVGGGIVYAVLWVYGLLIEKDSAANFVPLNTADDWLHFFLAAGMIALGLILGNRTRAAARTRA